MPQRADDIQLILNVIGEGLRGDKKQTLPDEKLERLIRLSRQFGVETLFYYLTKDVKQTIINHKHYRNLMVANYMTQQNLGCLLEQMEKNGIHVVVLKGYSLALFYPESSCRMSADADLLIAKEEEKRVSEYLLKHGFDMKGKRPRYGCDSQWYREDVGTIELHIALFNPLNIRALFFPVMNDVYTHGERRRTPIGEIWMLDPVSNLLYTFMHLSKHYYIGNMTLQMVIDFWILYRLCADKHAYIDECVRRLQQEALYRDIISFAETYFDREIVENNTEKRRGAEHIYRILFDGVRKNVYSKYVFARIAKAKKMDLKAVYLYCAWSIRILVNAVKMRLTK